MSIRVFCFVNSIVSLDLSSTHYLNWWQLKNRKKRNRQLDNIAAQRSCQSGKFRRLWNQRWEGQCLRLLLSMTWFDRTNAHAGRLKSRQTPAHLENHANSNQPTGARMWGSSPRSASLLAATNQEIELSIPQSISAFVAAQTAEQRCRHSRRRGDNDVEFWSTTCDSMLCCPVTL